ncbi:MAG TPA: nucleotidyl transferase AbiEii/AbiGii toxin family protein [Trueperaceae bacterium]|nr:nucleotidyl transferase AbiEii/AbiGii toxin family protein [Trueperaceae bacterium]
MDLDATLRFLKALQDEGVRYALVGGLAMIVHGRVRATRDVDIFVEVGESNVQNLRRALRSLFDDPSIEEITAVDLAGDYPAIRYVSPDGSLVLDIIARLGEAFDFANIEAQDAELEKAAVRVATAETLLRMKRDPVRDIDRLDAAWLRSFLRGEESD